MKIDNEVRVDAPIEQAWKALTDLEGLAPCMPGAQLTSVEGEVYHGKVRVKVGPVISQFQGTATFVEKDETNHTAVIKAVGKDVRGQGNASATVNAQLTPDGTGTAVSVSTDLNISGKLAQFGSGMIKEISEKLFAQFIANVEEQLHADPEPASPPERSSLSPSPSTATQEPPNAPRADTLDAGEPTPDEADQAPAPSTSRQIPPTVESAPLDLMQLAGKSVYKRMIPAACGVVVVGVVIYLLVR
jgi:carbon monoxide dehydrogenase subunit G